MIRWRKGTALFSLGVFCVLAGYVSVGAFDESTSKDVTRANDGELVTARVAKHYSGPELNRATVDKSDSERVSTIVELEHVSERVPEKGEGKAQSDSGPEYDHLYEEPQIYKALQVINPRSAVFLTHYAQLQPYPLSTDQSNDYLHSEEYTFLLAISYVCEKCALGYMFYEKYALGRSMDYEELKEFFDSPEFASSIDAVMSTDEYQNLLIELRL
jgi:hypothetical protein